MDAVFSGPGEGERTPRGRVLIKAERPELSWLESRSDAGVEIAPHVHKRHSDCFYVLDGALEFTPSGSAAVRGRTGSFFLAPPGSVHSFRVLDTSRYVNLHTPGGYGEYLRVGRRDRAEEFDIFDPDAADDAADPPIFWTAGEGELLAAEHRELRVKVARPELDVLEFEVRRGYEGPGPHFHKRHVDAFYVLDGELEFTVDGEIVRAGAGALVAVPPRTVHAFTNGDSDRTRFLNVHAPDCGFVELLCARARGEDVDPENYDIWDA